MDQAHPRPRARAAQLLLSPLHPASRPELSGDRVQAAVGGKQPVYVSVPRAGAVGFDAAAI